MYSSSVGVFIENEQSESCTTICRKMETDISFLTLHPFGEMKEEKCVKSLISCNHLIPFCGKIANGKLI